MSKKVYMKVEDIRAVMGSSMGLFNQLLTSEQMSGKHQPCPACGGGDRYRFDAKNERFYCNNYGRGRYGDAVDMLIHMEDDFANGCERAKLMLGIDESNIDKEALEEAERQRNKDFIDRQNVQAKRKSTNAALLSGMYELERIILKRKETSEPCNDELDQARYLYKLIEKSYRND